MGSDQKRKEIRKALINQLANLGSRKIHFEDMLEDYMGLWDAKNKLLADIDERGVTYEDYSSVGVKMQKNNPSVKELVMVNRQMLSILKELGIKTTQELDYDVDEL